MCDIKWHANAPDEKFCVTSYGVSSVDFEERNDRWPTLKDCLAELMDGIIRDGHEKL